MARRKRSAGVEERGMQARVLQEPGSSRDLPDHRQTLGASVEEVARADGRGIGDCAERINGCNRGTAKRR